MPDTITFKIKRQDSESSGSYWETFVIPHVPNSNVISCLMDIQANPENSKGEKVAPVVWECNCLEEVCGSCTMVINRKVRQSCSALVDQLEKPITLEPMSKFPVVRDLAVDRSRMFGALKKVRPGSQQTATTILDPESVNLKIIRKLPTNFLSA